MIHMQAKGMLAQIAHCHQINTRRMNHRVVSEVEFKKLPEDHQCKKCKKAAARAARPYPRATLRHFRRP
jgi:hypothetical protein